MLCLIVLFLLDGGSGTRMPMQYPDSGTNPITYTLFDRMISIATYHVKGTARTNYTDLITGVFITEKLVLTSFNGFRTLLTKEGSRENVRVNYVRGRLLHLDGRMAYFQEDRKMGFKIACARQVIPSLPGDVPLSMRFGPHTPPHDLMVLRLVDSLIFVEPPPPLYKMRFFPDFRENWKLLEHRSLYESPRLGPVHTILAEENEDFSEANLAFASLAHLDDFHVKQNRFVKPGEFGDVVDCEEWIPKEWGYFICLQNTEKYPGLANGAMLFSGAKLFGVGAFMLTKAEDSILVFTDIRPYHNLIFRTCTEDDQALQAPKTTYLKVRSKLRHDGF